MTSSESLAVGARQAFGRNQRDPQTAAIFQMSSEQRCPTVLLFSCSDSRIDPQAIFGASPGEIYHFRVPGNIAIAGSPDTKAQSGVSLSVDHVIHSAIEDMKVDVMAVLGHSECSTIESLIDPAIHPTPWAQLAGPIASLVASRYSQPVENKGLAAVAEHVRLQRERLLNRTDVQQALASGRLKSVEGYVYELGPKQQGVLTQWDEPKQAFVLVTGEKTDIPRSHS